MPDTFTVPETTSTTYLTTDADVLQNAALTIGARITSDVQAKLNELRARLDNDEE